jgi:predicted porin
MYKLSRNYTTANLETALNVYDKWVENNAKPKAEQIKQWEIGVELKLNKLAIKDAYSGLKQDRAVGRNLLGALVKRYLTQAQKTIKSLEEGIFPVIK